MESNINNLQFRRQFLFSPNVCPALESWKQEKVNQHFLYVHPDCELHRVTTDNFDFVLIGHAIDPRYPEISTSDVLAGIAQSASMETVPTELYGLSGRFVLIVRHGDDYTIFNDACGLKTCYYTLQEDQFYAASQPLLLKLVSNLAESVNYQTYFQSKYIKSNREHWLPSGISLYDEVYQLVPNHLLRSATLKQERYWPNKDLERCDPKEAFNEYVSLLKGSMLAAHARFNLALPITAGWDSRIILSACKHIAKEIYYYTLQYRDLSAESPDIKIPAELLAKLDLKHHVLNCHEAADEEFLKIYSSNTDNPHVDDWGYIAHSLHSQFPKEHVSVRGSCVEIGRGRTYFHGSGSNDSLKADDFIKLESGWENLDFIQVQVGEWFEGLKKEAGHFGYDYFDLFYWEQRMGSWQAQSQLEWDIVHESFTPFNNRKMLDILLSIDPKLRHKPHHVLFKQTMEELWNDVLQVPINPKTSSQKIKASLKSVLIRTGLLNQVKKILGKR